MKIAECKIGDYVCFKMQPEIKMVVFGIKQEYMELFYFDKNNSVQLVFVNENRGLELLQPYKEPVN